MLGCRRFGTLWSSHIEIVVGMNVIRVKYNEEYADAYLNAGGTADN